VDGFVINCGFFYELNCELNCEGLGNCGCFCGWNCDNCGVNCEVEYSTLGNCVLCCLYKKG